MQKVTITLETVTPMFLGGADARGEPELRPASFRGRRCYQRLPRPKKRGEPELRPASFRGVMRYWLRAAAGSISGENLESLHKVEGDIFGIAGDEETNRSSALSIRVANQKLSSISLSKMREYKKDGEIKLGKHGLNYLFFAARKTEEHKERSALQGSFDLVLTSRGSGEEIDKVFRKTYATLWLLTHLGGIGSRARRGAGNLQVVSTSKLTGDLEKYAKKFPLNIQSQTIEDLIEELSNGIRYSRNFIGQDISSGDMSDIAKFDILHPDTCKIYVVNKIFKDWNTALDTLGKAYKDFRFERQPDYDVIKNSVKTNEDLKEPIQRSSFGLPISLKDMSIEATSFERRSSPLLFRVIKLNTPKPNYALVLIWFKSEFLPKGEGLKLVKKDNNQPKGNLPENNLIETFLFEDNAENSLPNKDWGLLEVSL
jgi:CRISPR-associated protein Cmr1